MILIIFFCLFLLKMSVKMGCARKPLSPEPRLQTHPPRSGEQRVRVLCTPPALLGLPPAQQSPEQPWQLHLSPSKHPVSSFFKGSMPRLRKPQGRVKATAWRKRTNFHNKPNHTISALLVPHMIPRVQHGNNQSVSREKLKDRDRPKGRQPGYSSSSMVIQLSPVSERTELMRGPLPSRCIRSKSAALAHNFSSLKIASSPAVSRKGEFATQDLRTRCSSGDFFTFSLCLFLRKDNQSVDGKPLQPSWSDDIRRFSQ